MASQDTDYVHDVFISRRRVDALSLARHLRRRLQSTPLRSDIVSRLSESSRANAERPLCIYIDIAYERAASDFLSQKFIPALNASRRLQPHALKTRLRREARTPSCCEATEIGDAVDSETTVIGYRAKRGCLPRHQGNYRSGRLKAA
jgi:hypothetical protein